MKESEKEKRLPMSPDEGIVYVIRRGSEYLITKRVKKGSVFHNQYLFPGGLIEKFDQDLEAAVQREAKEERDVEVKSCRFVEKVTYPHPSGFRITQHVFLIEEGDYEGEVRNLEPEKEELFWMAPEEVKKVCTSVAARAVFEQLESSGVFKEV